MATGLKTVHQSPNRAEGRDKVTGTAQYIDDMPFQGCLYAKTVRSTIARGKIKRIRFKPGIPWNEFIIVTAKDIPGKNVVPLLDYEQPCLADGCVRHAAEPIAVIAHADKYLAEKALRHIQIDYEPMPAIFTIDDKPSRKQIQVGDDNVYKRFHFQKGDPSSVWKEADVVIKGEYATGAQEQLYIEPQGMVAVASPEQGVTVWGSMQCPYYVQKGLMPLFNLPPDKVRVIFAMTGGGFGGKEEYPTLPAGHAALVSWKAGGRPVKMIYDRIEDEWATTKRHPSKTRIKSAFRKDGKLLALEIDVTMDGGAYLTLTPVVLSRGVLHSFGPYVCDHVTVDGRAVFTNCPPYGAYRGFGAPQTIFAIERHLDRAAAKLKIDPVEIRRKNFLKKGDTMATGQEILEELDLPGILDRALAESDYANKSKAYAAFNKKSKRIKKGIGLATFFHGSGFTGSGEVMLASVLDVEPTEKGGVRVLMANTEIGQGAFTTAAQIAAETCGVELEDVEIETPDTARVPNSGPTVASRTCMVVGGLVQKASEDLRHLLVKVAGLPAQRHTPAQFKAAAKKYLREHGPVRVRAQYQKPGHVEWDDKTYQGSAYAAYAWACYVADVELDLTTCQTEVKDFVAVQEIGRAIHPVICKGQIEGGVAQAIGWALFEKVVLSQGAMANCQMTNYIMPTTADTPPIRVTFFENPYAGGPFGAKGIGELPMDGPAPALANALAAALSDPAAVTEIPALPEDILEQVT